MEVQNVELHRVVATAIIHKGGKYLITKRSPEKKVWPGKWTVPGGGLEVNDYINTPTTVPTEKIWYYALENTLRREVEEEAGVQIGKIDYLLDLCFIRPDNVPVITLSFYAPWKSGEVKLNSESVDHAWITVREIKNYEFIEGISREIEMVDELLKGADPETVKFYG
ncbi:MAG: NUDIX domain-containing protein [Candidatus Colwellbacteria bacterium]|nr:NUDIX domain-containing protein [Candidatus Colwellbacteria bacterium]